MAVKLESRQGYHGIIVDYLKKKFPDLSGIIQDSPFPDNQVTLLFKDGCRIFFSPGRGLNTMEVLESCLQNHKNCEKKQ